MREVAEKTNGTRTRRLEVTSHLQNEEENGNIQSAIAQICPV